MSMNKHPDALPARQSMQAGLWIFSAALLVRLVYFAWSQTSPYLFQLSTDEAFYVDYARHILAGNSFPYANFMDPLLAYLIAIPLQFTDNMHVVRLCFVGLDSVNAWLIYRVCLLITDKQKAAIAVAVLYVFYSMAVIYSLFITKSTVVIFLLLAISYCFLVATQHPVQKQKPLLMFVAGILSALLLFVGASYLLLVASYILLLLCCRAWRNVACYFIAGFILIIGLYMLYFSVKGEDKTLLPTNGGAIFYISNHAGNTLGTHVTPDFVHESTPTGIYTAFKQQAQLEDNSISNDKQVSSFWYKKTLEENLAYPHIAIIRLWHKFEFLLSNAEISQNYYLPYIKKTALHNLPLPTFAFMLAIGLSGFILLSWRDKRSFFIVMPVMVVMVSCVVFFVSARMRFPMVPFLMLGCAGWARVFSVDVFRRTVALLVFVIFLALSYFASSHANTITTPQDEYNLAITLHKAAMYNDAETLIDSVLARETLPKYLFLKAVIKSAKGQCEEALVLYDQIGQLHPGYPDVDDNRQWCVHFMKQKH